MEPPWNYVSCSNTSTNVSLFQIQNNTYFNSDTNLSNISYPCWDFDFIPHNEDLFMQFMKKINIYLTPAIILSGVTGNLLSFLVFSLTHLRKQSSSVYLASLALADMTFLIALFFVWLSWINIPLFHTQGLCQLVVYLIHVSAFMSIWFIAGFTIERYIIVWYPLKKERFCSPKRATRVVISISTVACIMYSYDIWTSGLVYIENIPICIPLPKYFHLNTVLTCINSTLSLVIPSTIVVILNIRIILKIISVHKRRQHIIGNLNHVIEKDHQIPATNQKVECQTRYSIRYLNVNACTYSHSSELSFSSQPRESQIYYKSGLIATSANTFTSVHYPANTNQNKHVRIKRKSQYRTARMLLIVSTIFVILNTPSYIFRLYMFIASSIARPSVQVNFSSCMQWQNILQLVFHLNFSINFFIYSACARQFRCGICILYGRFKEKMSKCHWSFTNVFF